MWASFCFHFQNITQDGGNNYENNQQDALYRLTLILLMWRKWWTPNNASKWQMGFNSAFKGLIYYSNLMFMGPCIVIIFWYIIRTRCTSHRVYLIWQLLYMFRASLSPIFSCFVLLKMGDSNARNMQSSYQFKRLKPTVYVMHQQFNIQQFYALPTLYLCVLYLSKNKQRLVPLTA